jgi:hypothetical protein
MIKTTGKVKLKSTSSNDVFEVKSDDLDWEQTGGEERASGFEVLHIAHIEYDGSDGKTIAAEWGCGRVSHWSHQRHFAAAP